ncbi:integrase-like protein [Nitrosomonas sp. Nm84]|nr:integrase-like protein [Nitrosomonas sp. Nm84]
MELLRTQYSQKFREQAVKLLKMSRKGGCNGSTPMESFWGILKTELVHHRRFKTRQQVIKNDTEYIKIFYDRQDKQERLGYLSPAQFTQHYYANLAAA